MRIYSSMMDAARETERELWEMGIDVHPQTMQDQDVGHNPDFMTKEIQGYGYRVTGGWAMESEYELLHYFYGKQDDFAGIVAYVRQEHDDRCGGVPMNPGNSHVHRPNVWQQFLHDGKFSYTYSERFAPQLEGIINELHTRPDTRQAILQVFNGVSVAGDYGGDNMAGADHDNMGGVARIPCSLHYQFLRRRGRLDCIYAMRSCDLLTHYPIDLALGMRLQSFVAGQIGIEPGTFTHFIGSLHAYRKDMAARGIF